MRAEYSEMNNSKMIELAFLPLTYLHLPAAREIDRDAESPILKYNDDVIGCNFESNSVDWTPICHRLDRVLDSNNMEYSRQSVRRKGVAEEGKFRLNNGIDNKSIGITFQW